MEKRKQLEDEFLISANSDYSLLKVRLLELLSLFEISRTLNASLNINSILNNILLTPMGRMMISKGIVLLNKGGDNFEVEILKGLTKGLLNKKISIRYLPDTPVNINDVDIRKYPWVTTFKELGMAVLLPMTSADKNLGLIGFGEKLGGEDYTQSEIEFLSSLSNIAATAVEKGLMFVELKETNRRLDKKIQELNTLFEIGKELNSTLEFDKITNLLAYAVMGEMMVYRCLIFLEDNGTMKLKLLKGIADPQKVLAAVDNDTEFLKSLSKLAEPQIISEDDNGKSKIYPPILRNYGITTLVPMRIQEQTKGVVALGNKISGDCISEEELEFLTALGNQAMICLENARLFEETLEKQRMEEDLNIARDIQKGLLPKSFPVMTGYEIFGVNIPSKQVGGDYYDCITIGSRRCGVAIADVSGKGVPAALLMANLQASLRALASESVTPKQIVAKINNLIFENTAIDKFITFFYGILDTQKNTFTYTNAGHNPPYLFHKDGSFQALEQGGTILGLMENLSYTQETVQLTAGDVIFMYTDGITEAMNADDEEFGEQRLIDLILEGKELDIKSLVDRVKTAVTEFTGNSLQTDDVTIVVIKAL